MQANREHVSESTRVIVTRWSTDSEAAASAAVLLYSELWPIGLAKLVYARVYEAIKHLATGGQLELPI